MSHKILFFAANRHQEIHFKHLLKIVKEDDEGVLLHKRALLWLSFFVKTKNTDFILVKQTISMRLAYFYNKTGKKKSYFWQFVMSTLYFISTILFLLKIKNVLSSKKIDMVVLWNDMKWHQYIVKKLALDSNIKTMFFENGALPNTVTLDPRGVNYNNSVPRDKNFYIEPHYVDQMYESKINSIKEGYIFVPFQVDYDTQIISHSPWIKDMGGFYDVLERLLPSLPSTMKIIIKEHPKSSRNYSHLHQNNPRISFKNSESTDDLVKHSCMVMTINSTVGLESIAREKPTVVLGNAFYGIDGLCQIVRCERDLVSKIQQLEAPNSILKNTFIEYLREYYVSGSWQAPTSEYIFNIKKRIYGQLENT